jgi:hypothetical protein
VEALKESKIDVILLASPYFKISTYSHNNGKQKPQVSKNVTAGESDVNSITIMNLKA